jgi:hypothetical protein
MIGLEQPAGGLAVAELEVVADELVEVAQVPGEGLHDRGDAVREQDDAAALALGALHQLHALIEELVLQDVLGVLLGEHGDAVLGHAAEGEVDQAVGEGAVGLTEHGVHGRGEGDEAEAERTLAEFLGVRGDVRRRGQHSAAEQDALDAEECGGVAVIHGRSLSRCGRRCRRPAV